MAYNMKGWSGFQNSPITKKVGPETGKFDVDNIQKIKSEDEESAYENAQNDYDTDNPTKKQLAIALAKVKAEKKR